MKLFIKINVKILLKTLDLLKLHILKEMIIILSYLMIG